MKLVNKDIEPKPENSEDFTEEEVMLRHYFLKKETAMPDVEAELRRFHEENLSTSAVKKSYILKIGISVIGVAAMLLLVFTLWHNTPSSSTLSQATDKGMLFVAKNKPSSQITLRSGNGHTVVINPNGQTSALTTMHEAVQSEDGQLVYSSAGESITPQDQQITIPRGKSYKLVLADGTEVWLNADSKLTFPNLFTGDTREVTLEGEAYFHVAKDKAHPFIVHTSSLSTTVTGTEFNVRAYAGHETHVTLVNGGVDVMSKNGEKKHIQPGEDATLGKQGSISVNMVDTDNFTMWKDGFFYFDNVPLETVLKEIGRWYNVNVSFENTTKLHTKVRYIGNREGSLQEAIDLLNSLRKVNAVYKGNTLYVR